MLIVTVRGELKREESIAFIRIEATGNLSRMYNSDQVIKSMSNLSGLRSKEMWASGDSLYRLLGMVRGRETGHDFRDRRSREISFWVCFIVRWNMWRHVCTQIPKLEKDRLEAETKRIGGLIKGATFLYISHLWYKIFRIWTNKNLKFTENVILLKSENLHFTEPCISLI